jgi:hypothetical protein
MQFIHRALLGACAFAVLAACGSGDEVSSGSGSDAMSNVSAETGSIGTGMIQRAGAANAIPAAANSSSSGSGNGASNDSSHTGTATSVAATVSTSAPAVTSAATAPAAVTSTGIAGTSATTPVNTLLLNTIEKLGIATASQAAAGLGFNVEPSNDWEFLMAAAAGATWVRFQCGWSAVETQTAPPANTNGSTRFVLDPGCQAGLASARKYGLKPTVLAAYGSPYHAILQVSLPSGAAAGSTKLKVALISGVGGDSLNNIAFPGDTIMATSGQQISQLHSYAGALITGVTLTSATTATLTLASALISNLPASNSVSYTINEYLHAPAASFSPEDPSNLAFAAYAEFLAQSIANANLQGEVELWNEPPWPDDPWDDRADFYDDPPATSNPSVLAPPFMPNFGFVAAIQARGMHYSGVNFVWGGTEKSGASSLFNWMQADTGVALVQPTQSVTTESMHPYGNSPEDSLWIESCLEGTIPAYPLPAQPFSPCNLNGIPGGNASLGEQFSLRQQSANSTWGVHREITETGFPAANGDDLHRARFITRQFLGYEAAGVTPIQFYRLFDNSSYNWGFVSQTASVNGSHTPNAAYTAISGLISDLKIISAQAPVATSAANLPQVTQYSGTYPLDTVTFVGAKSGAHYNSYLMTLWQRSNGANWGTLASPAAASVTVTIPQSTIVGSVINVDTRATVAYSRSGQTLTLQVSDDPVEILLVPGS